MRSTSRQLSSAKRRNRRGAPRAAKPSSDASLARYRLGFGAGFEEGQRAGHESFDTLFDGTSIIIPTYNQAKYLKSCIESISEHTDLPYEIIIVDNGSTDETERYLKQVGTEVRYKILADNHGFAGAVNIGLMMSKGTTLLLLNNDTLVTPNWLDNMLACLNSDDRVGMVGPVTNYISGDQRIDVPYTDISDMLEFARLYNEPNSAKWARTDRLTGFCLLFKRELLEKVGYLDEGYAIGNFEDDDLNVRVRLMGYSLAIAKDSFIHHFGSVSMKAVQSFEHVNDRNMRFYMDKWGNPHEWIHKLNEWRCTAAEQHPTVKPTGEQTDFYPQSGVMVENLRGERFWLDNSKRHPLEGDLTLPLHTVRLSQLDLRKYPIGPAVAGDDSMLLTSVYASASPSAIGDFYLASGPDGTRYWIEGGVKRRFVSAVAAASWGLDSRPAVRIAEHDLASMQEGLPIIAPVLLRQSL